LPEIGSITKLGGGHARKEDSYLIGVLSDSKKQMYLYSPLNSKLRPTELFAEDKNILMERLEKAQAMLRSSHRFSM